MTAAPKAEIGLYAKLAAITAELGYVEKDGTNDFQRYKYTSAEAMLAAIRRPLSAHGIALMPSVTALGEREYETSKGKASVITTAHVTFTLVDGATGEKHECCWAGQGDDPGDKGLGKAYTNAIKTFLRQQFLIPQGDDPEADASTDRRAADRSARVAPSNDSSASFDPTPEPGPSLPESVRKVVSAAIREAQMPTDWLRMQLVALGVAIVPDGPITPATLRGLSEEQADKLLVVCGEVVEARKAAEERAEASA